mgnify:CR=1 FL=1
MKDYEKKLVSVIRREDETVRVKVGSTDHPMEERHHIEWIEILVDEEIYRKHLKPGDKA